MAKNPSEFGRILKRVNRIIAACEEKSISIWHDELGYYIGREGGGVIEYWEKGNIPPDSQTVKLLAEELTKKMLTTKMALDSLQELEQFLSYGNYPSAKETAQDIWQKISGTLPALYSAYQPLLIEPSAFVSGGPIFNPRQFFGRKVELEDIFNGLKNTPFRHTAITGRWRSGKTSLLYYVKNINQVREDNLRQGQKNDWLSQASHYRWIWVNFSNPRLRQREAILKYLLKSFEMPVPAVCDLDNFEETVINRKIQKPTVVLMDSIRLGMEAPELDLAFWGVLRHLAQSEYANGQLAFLITSQDPIQKEARKARKDSPFFNPFTNIELGPFTEDETIELIESSPKSFTSKDKSWILRQSDLWPSLLQILCYERLTSLDRGETNEDWKERSLRQIATIKRGWEE